ncbi:retrovirus-related pol polyprotein from transposon TNT 1-94 [Tanacetum coccineum]
MLDAFTSLMREDLWGRINFARALVEIDVDSVLKNEVSIAIPLEDGSGHTWEVIRVEYEWMPPHCSKCKIFGHTNEKCLKRVKPFTNSDKCPKTVKESVIISTMGMNNDGFMEVKMKNNKDSTTQVGDIDVNKVKGTSTSNSFDALKNMDIRAEDETSSSRSTHEEDSESELKTDQCDDLMSDDEVDEYIFPEDDKFGDKFDIQLKGRVRKQIIEILIWYLDSGCSKHMTGQRDKLINFVSKFIDTVRFGNDHFAAIMDLEVAFRKHTCFARNLEGVDLLSGSRCNNLYTISLNNMMKSSPIYLLSKASKMKSWLWHCHLSHLNFGTISQLAKLGLVKGLSKLKYAKDHLWSACQMGKSKKESHKPKPEPSMNEKLQKLHMDLCGPMWMESINGKKYILVIIDDYT